MAREIHRDRWRVPRTIKIPKTVDARLAEIAEAEGGTPSTIGCMLLELGMATYGANANKKKSRKKSGAARKRHTTRDPEEAPA